jgi:hypothetical protein
VNSSTDIEQAIDSVEEPRTRRELLRAGGVAAVAGVLSVFGIATATEAKNGNSVRIGERNSGSKTTVLESSNGPVFSGRVSKQGKKSIAVQGVAIPKKGAAVGVQGQSFSPDASAGQFIAEAGGVAVEATSDSKRGYALRTKGRVQLSDRSGSSEASGGAEFVIPVAGGLSDKSLVLATLQDHLPGVHVEAASVLDAEEGLIVVRLNQAVPEPATVAWVVLD